MLLCADVWLAAEETDGHRLVVSTDIGIRSLVMNNLMPAPRCRYLKVRIARVEDKHPQLRPTSSCWFSSCECH